METAKHYWAFLLKSTLQSHKSLKGNTVTGSISLLVNQSLFKDTNETIAAIQ